MASLWMSRKYSKSLHWRGNLRWLISCDAAYQSQELNLTLCHSGYRPTTFPRARRSLPLDEGRKMSIRKYRATGGDRWLGSCRAGNRYRQVAPQTIAFAFNGAMCAPRQHNGACFLKTHA